MMNKISSSLASRKVSLTTTWALFNQQFCALETPRLATRHCVMYVSKKRIFSPFFPPLALSPAKKKKKKAARARERKSEADTVRAEQFHLSCSADFFTSLPVSLSFFYMLRLFQALAAAALECCQRAGEFYFAASSADAAPRSQRQC